MTTLRQFLSSIVRLIPCTPGKAAIHTTRMSRRRYPTVTLWARQGRDRRATADIHQNGKDSCSNSVGRPHRQLVARLYLSYPGRLQHVATKKSAFTGFSNSAPQPVRTRTVGAPSLGPARRPGSKSRSGAARSARPGSINPTWGAFNCTRQLPGSRLWTTSMALFVSSGGVHARKSASDTVSPNSKERRQPVAAIVLKRAGPAGRSNYRPDSCLAPSARGSCGRCHQTRADHSRL